MKKRNLTIILTFFIIISTAHADELSKTSELSNETSYMMQDEAEVNDIPFNTSDIVAKFNLMLNLTPITSNIYASELSVNNIDRIEYDFEEELEADDLPFNTYQIVKELNILITIDEVTFTLEDEIETNDIPFNTEEIVKSLR